MMATTQHQHHTIFLPELLLQIISFLPVSDLANCHAVSRTWRNMLKASLPARMRPLPDHNTIITTTTTTTSHTSSSSSSSSAPSSPLEETMSDSRRPLPKPICSLAHDIQYQTLQWLNPMMLIDISAEYYAWHDGAYSNLLNALVPYFHPLLGKHVYDLLGGIENIAKGKMGVCVRTKMSVREFEDVFLNEGDDGEEGEGYLTKPLTKSVEIYCVLGGVWDVGYENVRKRSAYSEWQKHCVRVEREKGVRLCDVVDELRGLLKAEDFVGQERNGEVLLQWQIEYYP